MEILRLHYYQVATNRGTLKDLNGNPIVIDSNGDSQIEVTEALNISYMELPNLFGKEILR